MPLPPKSDPPAGRPPWPSRARSEPAAPKKRYPLHLIGGIGAGAAALVVILLVALGGKKDTSETVLKGAPKPAPKPVEPDFTVLVHHVDVGLSRQINLFIAGTARGGPQDYVLVDAQGRRHQGTRTRPEDLFSNEMQREPTPLVIQYSVPRDAETLDLEGPGGKKLPIARPPGPEGLKPFSTPCPYEGWDITCSGTLSPDFAFDLEIKARRAVPDAPPIDPRAIFLVTDEGKALSAEAKSAAPPYQLRFRVPPTTKEIRLQTFFRGDKPIYLVYPVTPKEAPVVKPPDPAVPKPPDPAPAPAAGSLKAEFDAKASDPVAAYKLLAGNNTDEAKALARSSFVRFVNDDLAAGMKAFSENEADVAEKHLARAALLAEAYSPEFSRQLVRMIFLLKEPRKVPTGCEACKGAGSSPCGACKGGLAQKNCPRCEAKGHLSCLLCDGAGTMDHHGYKGKLLLTVASDISIRYQGAPGTLHGQTITWDMRPCARGGFHLRTSNRIICEHKDDPRVRRIKFDGNQPCREFWNEMKMFVFNGKATIQIMGRRGRMTPFTPTAARRFLADYEICKGGRVTCDRCGGRKTETCAVCFGKGQSLLPCSGCEGTSLKACEACKGYGDASWLARFLPPAPELQKQLSEQAVAIRDWLDDRVRRAARKQELQRLLKEVQKGLDPTAKLTDELLEVTCQRCQGKGGECEECWATGRREFFAGTAQYERYALADRLKRQLDESAQTIGPPAVALVEGGGSTPVAVAPPKPPPSVINPAVPGQPTRMLEVPKTVDEIIKKADKLHESGKKHLETAKSTNDEALWVDEAVKALNDLRDAQTLYATAQEKLDEAGAPVPRELQTKFRVNMQALLMARRTAP